jgi:hypothetical protein
VETPKGDKITLTQNDKYTIMNVDGLAPPTAAINVAVNANFDGSTYTSSRMGERNIVIQFAIEGNVEQNRIELYKVLRPKAPCRVRYTNNHRNVYIDGYVESFDCNFFNEKEVAQISILCPYPYFSDDMDMDFDFSTITPLFEFPFDIDSDGIEFSTIVLGEEKNIINNGDIETGMLIQFTAAGGVTNPKLINTVTNEKVLVNLSLSAGDVLEINTNRGKKSVKLIHNGVISNQINALDKTSKWLQLEVGDNLFVTDATSGGENLLCNVMYGNLFGGV